MVMALLLSASQIFSKKNYSSDLLILHFMSHDICVLGLGYIGLPTASVFATRGKKVLGVDVLSRVVDTINRGEIHIKEPELDVLVSAAVNSGNLRASLLPEMAKSFVVAVPTPFKFTQNNPKAPDLLFVESATRSIAPVVAAGNLVILESTSPVGTTEMMRDWLFDELEKIRPQEVDELRESVMFAHCPERILPGQMLKELVANDRIVGGLTSAAAVAARELYRTFCLGEIILTDARTAEMCKLTENASRDVSIAFANELSIICERLGINVWELIILANRHPRVKILQPGPGVGGHCIAVDPWFIVDAAPDVAHLIKTAREVNDSKPHYVVDRIKICAERFHSPIIACLGLAFKADVDDLRESPAMEIVEHLIKDKVGRVIVVEPHISELPLSLSGNVKIASIDTAVAEADIVVLLVGHQEFLKFNRSNLEGKVVVDTRGFWR
jgi:UDP-N-acetyl-D-mannosaminuronic acid dehydrogenase